jgi:predicted porin
MNKKLMAVAVAGALAAPAVAFAQASNVTLYGRANLGLDQYSATGATAGANADFKSRTRVFDNGSRFGLRGEEDLGGGLKAIFMMENGIAMDSGSTQGQNGSSNTSVGLGARVAYVGLQGGWGALRFGKQNVWWGNGEHEQWQTNYGSVGNQFFTGGFGRNMSVSVNRVQNTMQYESPVWSGVNFIASYSPTAQELAQPSGVAAIQSSDANGRIMGLTLQGKHPNGIIWAWDYASNRNNSNNPLNGSTQETTGNKLRAGYLYNPGANISLFFIRMNAKNGGAVGSTNSGLASLTTRNATGLAGLASAANIASGAAAPSVFQPGPGAPGPTVDVDVRQQGWGLVWEHMWGNFGVEANYSRIANITGFTVAASCVDTNNTTWFLGGRYNLSKRTSVLAYYLQYRNAANYNADMTAGGMSSINGTVPNGADPKAVGVGIQHNF